jgi:hypothetical protein
MTCIVEGLREASIAAAPSASWIESAGTPPFSNAEAARGMGVGELQRDRLLRLLCMGTSPRLPSASK